MTFVRSRFTHSPLIHGGGIGSVVVPPTGYSFTMTAGDFDGALQGYSNGGLGPAFGSIDQEPVPGETLLFLATGSAGNEIHFQGDIVALLAGLSVWVDSVEYPFDSDWVYSGGNNTTSAGWTAPNAPTFVNTNMYFVEIK